MKEGKKEIEMRMGGIEGTEGWKKQMSERTNGGET